MFKVYVTFNEQQFSAGMERKEMIYNVKAGTWFEAIQKVIPMVRVPSGSSNVRMIADTLPTAEVYILE